MVFVKIGTLLATSGFMCLATSAFLDTFDKDSRTVFKIGFVLAISSFLFLGIGIVMLD